MSGMTGPDAVTDATFGKEVREADRPVLVEFTAAWCPSCRQMAPVLRALAEEHGDRLKVVTVDVDTSPATAAAHQVLSIPAFFVYRGGEPVRSLVGARSRRRLLQELGLDDVMETTALV
ncbi:thioredoxin family protein [Streptomyces sp. NPDC057638]|uniref:thioredoxin family protein n=1 Tax=Streptomyces sp. NPDC057638 TaxID=3346190 RepID=UPI0036C435F1